MKMNMNIYMGNESEGTYDGYTASTQEFTADRKAGLERAIAFAKAEQRSKSNG